MNAMIRKSFTATLAAVSLAASFAATATPASARGEGAIAAGIIGGLALGAMAAGAANAQPYYTPRRVQARCWFERRAAYNRWGDVVGYRRIRVCG